MNSGSSFSATVMQTGISEGTHVAPSIIERVLPLLSIVSHNQTWNEFIQILTPKIVEVNKPAKTAREANGF